MLLLSILKRKRPPDIKAVTYHQLVIDKAVSGTTVVDGTVDFTTSLGSRTFQGDVTVNGTWNNNGQASILINADVFVNGAFNCQTGSNTIAPSVGK